MIEKESNPQFCFAGLSMDENAEYKLILEMRVGELSDADFERW